MEFLIYYVAIGYIINNILALIAIFGSDEGQFVEVDFPAFILTIPVWPYTLYNAISAIFSKEE